jgi:hypothetical protein
MPNLIIGSSIDATCRPIGKLLPQLFQNSSNTLQKRSLSGTITSKGKLLLASRKIDYINQYYTNGLSICNSNFAIAKKLLRLSFNIIANAIQDWNIQFTDNTLGGIPVPLGSDADSHHIILLGTQAPSFRGGTLKVNYTDLSGPRELTHTFIANESHNFGTISGVAGSQCTVTDTSDNTFVFINFV